MDRLSYIKYSRYMDIMTATSSFAAISQPTRLAALRLLVQAGPGGMPAGEIGERLGVRQNTMSANLSVLTQAGLLNSQRAGRSIRYFANFAHFEALLVYLMKDCCGGRIELCGPLLEALFTDEDKDALNA